MPAATHDAADRRARFRRLHEAGCFLMPNPWDVGSARWLASLGVPALASTSAGLAFSLGLPDGGRVALDEVLSHLAALVQATDLPVNADLEAGYAAEAAGVATSVRRALATGVAGLSIEDATGDRARPLYPLDEAVARLAAARRAIDEAGPGAVLTGRAECFLTGHPDPLPEALRRLTAYAAAGADCLYAPGLRTPEQVAAVVRAVAPKPVNVLASGGAFTLAQLAGLGVRRVSLGGGLARAAWSAFQRAAEEAVRHGTFSITAAATPHLMLDAFFRGAAGRG
jgi:2-methylisocitrate lyase-like PEP mutase family enzyme